MITMTMFNHVICRVILKSLEHKQYMCKYINCTTATTTAAIATCYTATATCYCSNISKACIYV